MRFFPAILIFCLLPLTAFAADRSPVPALAEPDQDYYRKVFDYTMETIPAGGTYEWHCISGTGSISVSAPYASKSGSTCRNFTETYAIDDRNGTDSGVACKRSSAQGWCRLKKNSALTCAMEPPASVVDEKLRDAGEFMSRGGDKANGLKHSWENWTPW